MLGLGYFAYHLSSANLIFFVLPAAGSITYIAPLFKGRRFRDLPYVKVFVVGFVWTWVEQIELTAPWLFALLEKFLFITAITLPFDIRDLQVDGIYEIKTLPQRIGQNRSIRLAQLMLVGSGLCVLTCTYHSLYGWNVAIALLLSYLGTIILIHFASPKRHDYYFSALLDGTIIIQFAFVMLFTA